MSRVLRYLGGALGALLLLLLILLGYGYFRPNRARVVDALGIEHWAAVSDGAHNSNTDLIYWRGAFYLVHASSPWHFASEKCRLVIWRSEDARHWERLAELNVPGEDIRDPSLPASAVGPVDGVGECPQPQADGAIPGGRGPPDLALRPSQCRRHLLRGYRYSGGFPLRQLLLNDSGTETLVVLSRFYPRVQAVRQETPLRHVVVTAIREYMGAPTRWLYALFNVKRET